LVDVAFMQQSVAVQVLLEHAFVPEAACCPVGHEAL
jgi:hypothetical protein